MELQWNGQVWVIAHGPSFGDHSSWVLEGPLCVRGGPLHGAEVKGSGYPAGNTHTMLSTAQVQAASRFGLRKLSYPLTRNDLGTKPNRFEATFSTAVV